jgi:hypothetical protein
MYIGCMITRWLVAGLSPQRPGFDRRSSVHMRFVLDKVALGGGFSPNSLVFPSQYHSTNAPHSSSCTCCSYQKDKWAKAEKLPKTNAVFDVAEIG